jgi:antitoxin HicB
MKFPVKLSKEPEGGYTVTFPDIPEAITCGESIEDALYHAKDALESAMDFYLDDKRPVPAPSKPKRGQHTVELPASVAAKVLLLNEMSDQKVRPAELARRLKVTPQEVTRLIDWRHTSKIDGIAGALKALGKTLEIRANAS